jgi:hypothetical protein
VTVFVGLSVATFLTLVIVPVFYALLETIRERMWGVEAGPGGEGTPPGGGAAGTGTDAHTMGA